MLRNLLSLIVILGVSGCVSLDQQQISGKANKSIGKLWFNPVRDDQVPVFFGDITRTYSIIGPVSERKRQICGPNYYDAISGAVWVSHKGYDMGADAVIQFESERIRPKNPLLSCGEFEGRGVAVKFKQGS